MTDLPPGSRIVRVLASGEFFPQEKTPAEKVREILADADALALLRDALKEEPPEAG